MLNDDVLACAGIVERGDPWRFRTLMAAPLEARAILFPVYAFNVEVSRAPWVTQEPMIAEMRLQWWRDALEEIASGAAVRRHEVVTPLSKLLSPQDAKGLDEAVAARRWDIYRDSFEDEGHFDRYIDQTAGHLMWTAAKLLGHKDEAGTRALGYAAGLAAYFRAVPALEAAGRIPLLDGTPAGVKALAQRGLEQFNKRTRKANPAHWPAAGTRRTLAGITRNPECVGQGGVTEDPGAFALIKASVFGRL